MNEMSSIVDYSACLSLSFDTYVRILKHLNFNPIREKPDFQNSATITLFFWLVWHWSLQGFIKTGSADYVRGKG